MIFGTVALPLQAPFAIRILILCFVPVLTSDLLPIPLNSFYNEPCASWHRTRHQDLRIDPTRLAEIIDFTVSHPGRTFLHLMLDVLCKAHHPTDHLRWNHAFHKDAFWWRNSLPSWKGRSFFYVNKWTASSQFDLYNDACQSGFGFYFAGDRLYGSFAGYDVPCPVRLCSRSSSPLPLPSALGQHPLLTRSTYFV